MGNSTNRNLQAKHAKSKLQKIEAAQLEYSKPCYSSDKTIPAYDACMVRRVGMVRTDRKLSAVVRGIEIVAWKRGEKALTTREMFRQHF
jgi:hypothetical protein